ncbi:MAG: hypothetical protein Q9200_005726 [Gallowayella weberi]
MLSPFPPSTSAPGTGIVKLALRPPDQPVFETLTFSYPLKLVVSAPHNLSHSSSSNSEASTATPSSVALLFLLSYGGGLVSGDHIYLSISLAPSTRLTVATQGSTKIFKPSLLLPSTSTSSPSTTPITRQDLKVKIAANAALWLGPDPCQPFAFSRYAQTQIFEVDIRGGGSLGLVDWVSEGRSARGEKWEFEGWRGRNEIWDVSSSLSSLRGHESRGVAGEKRTEKKRRLILRDSLILTSPHLPSRVDGLGIFGTVILIGPLLSPLANFFIEEFKSLPRIGARDWNAHDKPQATAFTDTVPTEAERREQWRKKRQEREKEDGILWTAANVRGAVVVKFGAREVEGAKVWLGGMLKEEGTVGRDFGPGGLMCVK